SGGADVASFLWIWTKRPTPGDRGRRETRARGDDLIRRGAPLYPRYQGSQHVELIGRRPSTPVAHVWDEKKTGEFRGLVQASVLRGQRVVIPDRTLYRGTGIAHAVVPDDLAATIPEFRQVGGRRECHHRRALVERPNILVEIEAQRVGAGIRRRQPD